MPQQILIALAAGIGGVAPSLIHLAQGFGRHPPDVPGPFFFAGVAIFFALGAVVAYLFAETNTRKAFFLGVGLPALVATVQTPGSSTRTAGTGLIPSAHAQVSVSPSETPSPPWFTFKPAGDCKGCEVWFTDASGKVLAKEVLGAAAPEYKINVPRDAAALGVSDPRSNFKLVPVPKDASSSITLEFSRKYSPMNDLRRGLGDYERKSYEPALNWKTK